MRSNDFVVKLVEKFIMTMMVPVAGLGDDYDHHNDDVNAVE